MSLTEPDYTKSELNDLRFFLHSLQTTHGSILRRLDRLTFSLACLVGNEHALSAGKRLALWTFPLTTTTTLVILSQRSKYNDFHRLYVWIRLFRNYSRTQCSATLMSQQQTQACTQFRARISQPKRLTAKTQALTLILW